MAVSAGCLQAAGIAEQVCKYSLTRVGEETRSEAELHGATSDVGPRKNSRGMPISVGGAWPIIFFRDQAMLAQMSRFAKLPDVVEHEGSA